MEVKYTTCMMVYVCLMDWANGQQHEQHKYHTEGARPRQQADPNLVQVTTNVSKQNKLPRVDA
jgi:hypothetical protein